MAIKDTFVIREADEGGFGRALAGPPQVQLTDQDWANIRFSINKAIAMFSERGEHYGVEILEKLLDKIEKATK